MTFRRTLCLASILLACAAVPRPSAAQEPPRPRREPAAPAGPVVTAGELERWFDSYVLLQAQDTLKVSDAQFPRFLPKLKALQDTKRRHLQARRQILATLGKLVKADPPDEGQIREQMRAIRELDAKAADEVRKAYDALDEVLDAGQQARFRLFEDQIERKKLDLLIKARERAAQEAL